MRWNSYHGLGLGYEWNTFLIHIFTIASSKSTGVYPMMFGLLWRINRLIQW